MATGSSRMTGLPGSARQSSGVGQPSSRGSLGDSRQGRRDHVRIRMQPLRQVQGKAERRRRLLLRVRRGQRAWRPFMPPLRVGTAPAAGRAIQRAFSCSPNRAAWVRLLTSSLAKMFSRCLRTVCLLMNSCSDISTFDRPLETMPRISRSRAVSRPSRACSFALASGGAACGGGGLVSLHGRRCRRCPDPADACRAPWSRSAPRRPPPARSRPCAFAARAASGRHTTRRYGPRPAATCVPCPTTCSFCRWRRA